MDEDHSEVERVLAGDTRAFGRLVVRHQSGLLALVRNLGLDAQAAEDVAQDAFLAAYAHLATFDPRRGGFRAWLYGIGRNQARNTLRRRHPAAVGHLDRPADGGMSCVEGDLLARLDRALGALPFERRAAFVLAEIHGLTHAEVARIEGVAVGTVKSRVSRARKALRLALQPQRERAR